jgi:hypothetical protein
METPVIAATVDKPVIDPAGDPFYLQSPDPEWPNSHPLEPQSHESDSDSLAESEEALFAQIPADPPRSDLPQPSPTPDQASTSAKDFLVATADPVKTPPAPVGRRIPPPGPLSEVRYKPQRSAFRRLRAARGYESSS